MKRIFVSLPFILAVGLTTVLAGEEPEVTGKIKESFKKEFIGAELVKWNKVKDYREATFVLHEHRVIAFFNEDGELLGSARTILFDQLPLVVIKSLDKKFTDADFIEVSEISNTEGTSYHITAEKQNNEYQVKVSPTGNILSVVKVK